MRPFFALATPGQLVPPGNEIGNGVVETFWSLYLDEGAGTLTATGSLLVSPNFQVQLRGPAAPGQEGPILQAVFVGPEPLVFSDLTLGQMRDLKQGRMYLEIAEPPFTQGFSRGQILPIEGVRYPSPSGR